MDQSLSTLEETRHIIMYHIHIGNEHYLVSIASHCSKVPVRHIHWPCARLRHGEKINHKATSNKGDDNYEKELMRLKNKAKQSGEQRKKKKKKNGGSNGKRKMGLMWVKTWKEKST